MDSIDDEATTGRLRVGDKTEIAQIRRLYASGQIEEAMALADKVRAQEALPPTAVPVVTVTMETLMRLPLDHRAGFMLTRIDGVSNVRTIIDISAMPPDEALAVLEKLLTIGALGLASEGEEKTVGDERRSTSQAASEEPPTMPRESVPPRKRPSIRKREP